MGDTIRAAFSGKVRVVNYERSGYGNYVVIRHYNGLETVYGHLSKQLVAANEYVKAGDPIGLGGNTGRSTGSHLHFETRLLGEAINPAFLFDFPDQDVTNDFYVYRNGTSSKRGAYAANNRSSKKSSAAGVRYHRVVKGESLSKIASKCGTTISELCSMNGISRTTKLRLGQILRYSN